MSSSRAIEALKEALRRLPGVGPKTAQRMAFHLMERDRDGASEIASALQNAIDTVQSCTRCNTFCEAELCDLCGSSKRDASALCVVETPADLEAIEQSGAYSGMYFVLMGQLSPIDGVGPDKLGFDRLNKLIAEEGIGEVIIATNLTAEGEATAEYLRQLTDGHEVRTTRLARGVPIGGELEYMDQRTVSQAFQDRREMG
jgi:recombination protein RecR